MKSFIVPEVLEEKKLIRYLGSIMPEASNGFLYKMLRKKNIVLNDKKADGNEALKSGDEIKIYFSDDTFFKFSKGSAVTENVTNKGLDNLVKSDNVGDSEDSIHEELNEVLERLDFKKHIIYEDSDILIINKPADLLSQKAKKEDISLTELVNFYLSREEDLNNTGFRAGVCNRLDRNTTGVISVGKSVKGLHALNDAIKNKYTDKWYLTLIEGRMEETIRKKAYLVKDRSHNKSSIYDDYREDAFVIETEFIPEHHYKYKGKTYTLIKVKLYTGKSHQIRAHLKHLGYRVVGDSKYGSKDNYKLFKKDFKLKHHLLHAGELSFYDNENVSEILRGKAFKAPPPKQFKNILSSMEVLD
ncbi:MAG: RluA family pseudouridine synthase [Lachnospiraceae bacterium]|nr:RluA family pseudouridine synthase [Lachnospiraceae bacterium]